MASADNNEIDLDGETSSAAHPNEPPGPPPPESLALSPRQEDDASQDLVLYNQEIDIVPWDIQPGLEGFALPPPDHELPPSTMTMTTLNQPTTPIPWTMSRQPLDYLQPPSSLPPWRYTSPRLQDPSARLPTAMAHRAHTPLPRPATITLPTATPMLKLYNQHGLTTYSTSSSPTTHHISLNPADPNDRDVLGYTDAVPMAGKFLRTAEYRKGMKAIDDRLREHGPLDVLDAENASQMAKEGLRGPGQ